MKHRRLQDDCQNENDENCFIPLNLADELGLVGPLRVQTVVVDPRANAEGLTFNSCAAEGQTVDPCKQAGYRSCADHVCTAKQVITQRTIDIIQDRLEWVSTFLANTFRVKTSKGGVTVGQSAKREFAQAQLKNSYDTDVLVIVTLQPAFITGALGYASCVQHDQFGRCTIGLFNWSPESE